MSCGSLGISTYCAGANSQSMCSMGLNAQWCDTCILGAASHAKNACVYLGKGTPKGPREWGLEAGYGNLILGSAVISLISAKIKNQILKIKNCSTVS